MKPSVPRDADTLAILSNSEPSHTMKIKYTIEIETDESGLFVASVHELEGCHTQAATLAEVLVRIGEAICLCTS